MFIPHVYTHTLAHYGNKYNTYFIMMILIIVIILIILASLV